ncbi:MAG: Hsp70 family protein [Deltaproteobacteria bacterium]|nr:Hsp70 family protein [Deltaproteobacteria bacterium]
METAIGIDLGTSYSTVAAVVDGKPQVLADDEGMEVQPSIVAFLEGGEILVGRSAKTQLSIDPFNTIYSAKRLIGRRVDDPDAHIAINNLPYSVVPGPNEHPVIRVRGERVSIPEVSAYVLRLMKKIAERRLGLPVDKAVITVPANFNDAQRESTRIAGRIAGLDVIRIINEPTAAALAYGYGRGLDRLIALYDFGGGTFDFTLLEVQGLVFRVISTAGDMFLGGDDFDDALAHAVANSFWKQTGIELQKNVVEWQRVLLACESCKRALSQETAAPLHVERIAHTAEGVLDLSADITRDLFNSLCFDLVRRSFAVCERALADAKVRPEDIDDVIMVGGSTYIPLVGASVEQFFSKEPRGGVSPETAVALGAAIQAYSLMAAPSPQPEDDRTVLLDVLPHSIGIVAAGGVVERVLKRNVSIPVEQSRLFSTSRDNQTELRIRIVQGEAPRANENTALGELIIDGLRAATRGTVEVLVTFEVDTNGILNVTARDRDSGRIYKKSVKVSGELDDQEIARASRRQYASEGSKEPASEGPASRDPRER